MFAKIGKIGEHGNDDNRRTGLPSSDAAICSRRKSKVRPQRSGKASEYIFPRLRILHSRIIVQVLTQKQIAVPPQPSSWNEKL